MAATSAMASSETAMKTASHGGIGRAPNLKADSGSNKRAHWSSASALRPAMLRHRIPCCRSDLVSARASAPVPITENESSHPDPGSGVPIDGVSACILAPADQRAGESRDPHLWEA